MDKPTSSINIGGIKYPLYLNLYAVEEITKKFGDLEKLGDMIYNVESFSDSIDTLAELVVILTTQGIAFEKYFNKEYDLQPLTVEQVKLLGTPMQMRDILTDALTSGSDHSIESDPLEDSEKNLSDE